MKVHTQSLLLHFSESFLLEINKKLLLLKIPQRLHICLSKYMEIRSLSLYFKSNGSVQNLQHVLFFLQMVATLESNDKLPYFDV